MNYTVQWPPTMINMQAMITEFSQATGGDDVRPYEEWADFRTDLIIAEVLELVEALQSGNMSDVAHEMADVLYAVIGSAVRPQIDVEEAFRIIHISNMQKASAGIVSEDGKILKPPGYQPPDMTTAIAHVRKELVA